MLHYCITYCLGFQYTFRNVHHFFLLTKKLMVINKTIIENDRSGKSELQ